MKIPAWLLLPVALLFGAGCHDTTTLVKTSCAGDNDCPAGQLCDQGTCVDESKFRCTPVSADGGVGDGGAPATGLLQPDPHVVDFGTTSSSTVSKTVTLRNIGSCSLTVFGASLKGDTDAAFTCDGCDDKDFPVEIFPMRQKTLTVNFTAPKVGSFSDQLVLLSDDGEFPTLPVPVRAEFDGVPKLLSSPDAIKFDYVAQGALASRVVQLANHGTGTAQIKITGITLDPADTTAFSLEDSATAPLPTADAPVILDPTGVDPRASYLFTLDYHPRGTEDDSVTVVIATDTDAVGTVRVSASGTSQGAPVLSISPPTVDFGNVPLGQMQAQTITLQNNGGSTLSMSYTFENNCPNTNPKCSTDFSFDTATLPDVEPGKFYEMQVFVQPSSTDALSGLLHIASNDPSKPDAIVDVSAKGSDNGMQVLKVEVSYDNGTDGAFDDDLRRIDAGLENPYGFLCDQATPKPLDWADFGTPTWVALGAKLNPQRVLLVDPKQDGKFRVLLQYSEDCASLPSQLLASILGISVDVLIQYFTGGTVNIDPGDVGKAIDSACLSHKSTTATVTVWVNGKTIAEQPATLAKKGDFVYALDLTLSNGVFTAK